MNDPQCNMCLQPTKLKCEDCAKPLCLLCDCHCFDPLRIANQQREAYAVAELDRLLSCMRGKTIDWSLDGAWEDIFMSCDEDGTHCHIKILSEGPDNQSLLEYIGFNAT